MREYTRPQKKILRELLAKAYERELKREIERLFKKFHGWKENFLTIDDLYGEIHKFHDGAFAPGQVYVALSRCRSLEDMSLARPIAAHEVKCDPRIKRFYGGLARIRENG